MSAPFARLVRQLFARPESRSDRRTRLGMEALEARDVPAVTFTVEALSDATEGGSAGQFLVTAHGDVADFTPTVYAVWGPSGTATYTTDYTTNPSYPSYLTFGSPGSTQTITISAVDDTSDEGSESVTVGVQRYTYYPYGPTTSATLTLIDNDAPSPTPTVAVGAARDAVEGGPSGIFRFSRDGDTGSALTFTYSVQSSGSGVATSGTDYTALSGSATFPAGENFIEVEVEALTDTATESPESVTVTVDDGSAYDPADELDEATLTISDPEPTAISIARLSDAAEGDTGYFLFTRTGDVSASLTVTYTVDTVGSGLASAGSDYTTLSGAVTFTAGASYAVVAVDALTDSAVEGAEAVSVHVSASSTYDIDVGTATVYVTDGVPVVWIDSSPSSVDEDDTGTIVLKRSGGNLDGELVVALRVCPGSFRPLSCDSETGTQASHRLIG